MAERNQLVIKLDTAKPVTYASKAIHEFDEGWDLIIKNLPYQNLSPVYVEYATKNSVYTKSFKYTSEGVGFEIPDEVLNEDCQGDVVAHVVCRDSLTERITHFDVLIKIVRRPMRDGAFEYFEASGDPAYFNNGRYESVITELMAYINYTQDLNGYDHPWVGGGGKNKCQPLDSPVTRPTGITVTPQADGSVILNGTQDGSSATLITASFNVKQGVAYIASIGNYDANVIDFGVQGFGRNKTVNHSQDFHSTGIALYVTDGTTLNNVRLYPQIEEGSSATAYEPYSNICPITGYTEANVSFFSENMFSMRFLTGWHYVAIQGDEAVSTASGFNTGFGGNAAGLKGKIKFKPNTYYLFSLEAYSEGNISQVGNGLTFGFMYTDGTTSYTSLPNNTLEYTSTYHLSRPSKSVDYVWISFASQGNNIWHVRKVDVRPAGTSLEAHYSPYVKRYYNPPKKLTVNARQMFANPHMESISSIYWNGNSAFGTFSIENNKAIYSITAKNTSASIYYYKSDDLPVGGHTYLLSFWLTTTQNGLVATFMNGGVSYLGFIKANERTRFVYSYERGTESNKNVYIYPNIIGGLDVGSQAILEDANMYDLTEMFGEGNEDIGLQNFLYNFPENYYPYSATTSPMTFKIFEQEPNKYNVPLSFEGENIFTTEGQTLDRYLSSTGVESTSSNYRITDYLPIEPQKRYIIEVPSVITTTSVFHAWYDAAKNLITAMQWHQEAFMAPSNARFLRVSYHKNNIPTSIRVSVGKVAKGNIDVISGKLTVTHGLLEDASILDYGYQSTANDNIFASQYLSNTKNTTNAERNQDIACSGYKPSETVSVGQGMDNCGFLLIGTTDTFRDVGRLYFRNDSYKGDRDAFKVSMAGIQVAFPYKETCIYQLTPQDIATILGDNNYYVDTNGNIEIKGKILRY